eukprot:scaffold46276_cov53-Phaeocystis_antarctica.AAC.2
MLLRRSTARTSSSRLRLTRHSSSPRLVRAAARVRLRIRVRVRVRVRVKVRVRVRVRAMVRAAARAAAARRRNAVPPERAPG